MMKTTLVAAAFACLSAMTAQAHVGLSKPCGRYQPNAGCPAPPRKYVEIRANWPIANAWNVCMGRRSVLLCPKGTYNQTNILYLQS